MENTNPLVSIVVISYNSSKYVLETLESAKVQTYENIELIVSDDCSIDNTVEICRNWINENRNRFVRTELITFEKNTGIPANCNRGAKAAKGEWIKLIAGDDILAVDCVKNIVEYSKINPQAEIVASCAQHFLEEFKPENFGEYRSIKGNENFFNTDISALEQYNFLLRKYYMRSPMCSPSVYVKKSALIKNDFYDERYFMEDYSFFLKATKNGYKFYFMDKLSVYYRVHTDSASSPNRGQLFDAHLYLKSMLFEKKEVLPYLKWHEGFIRYYKYYIIKGMSFLNMNKDNVFCKSIFVLLYYSPFRQIQILKNSIHKHSKIIKK